MKLISDRIWSGDLEIVFQDEKPYVSFLSTISRLTNQESFFDTIEENWFVQNGTIDICITYTYCGQVNKIWTKRIGDFVNTDILCLLNRQMIQSGYQFEYSPEQGCIYYINAVEKMNIESRGVFFQLNDALNQFEFLLYNVVMDLESIGSEFTYGLIGELSQVAAVYYDSCKHLKNLKTVQQMIKMDLLENINWEKIADMGIDIGPLHAFAHRIT